MSEWQNENTRIMWKIAEEFVFGFLLVCVAQLVKCELFTSTAQLRTSFLAGRDLANAIITYVNYEEERLNKLKSIAEEMKSHSEKVLGNPDLTDPVDAFIFIKRFTTDWKRNNLDDLIYNDTANSMRKSVDHIKKFMPKDEDLQGAAAAVMRIQDTYMLDTARIAQGDMWGFRTPVLTLEDCFELGRLSYMAGDYIHSSTWMSYVLDKIQSGSHNVTFNRTEVLEYLAHAEYKNGNVKASLTFTEELLALEPNHLRSVENKPKYERLLETESTQQTETKMSYDRPWERRKTRNVLFNLKTQNTFEALCRGEDVMEVVNAHKMGCRYKTMNHPLLFLSPVKEEDVFLDPWIVLYYDVISDDEIEILKKSTFAQLSRAKVKATEDSDELIAPYRISKSAGLWPTDKVVATLHKRINGITGLDLSTAELLSVVNYGLGGHYLPHLDSLPGLSPGKIGKNRVATFLFYLSSVTAGGATVFPKIGVKAFPVKGAALFWYNLHRNGDNDLNTSHGACPVLVGTKWAANQWIPARTSPAL